MKISKSLGLLWLVAGCAGALAKNSPPPPAPAPVANAVGSVSDIGAVSAHTHYQNAAMWTVPNGLPSGSYDVFTDIYTFSLATAADVTATASIPGAANQKTYALAGDTGELALYVGVYETGSSLSSYTLESEVSFSDAANSLVADLAAGSYFFVVEGTTAGSQGGKYSLAVTAAAAPGVSVVPEPGKGALLLAGIGLVLALARRRRIR